MTTLPFAAAARASDHVEDAQRPAEVAPELSAESRKLLERRQPAMVARNLLRRLAKGDLDLLQEVTRQARPACATIYSAAR